ncbi:sigma factor-like helix-turn-helix DNA-binding protein [Paenibacillus sp. BSR1-1]|uniref:sigma factor-like helix-turn-helix DNA-binding protein n=1 Tax=Paenibacillus sp. BSR1-1 TaxID=3020845 RepID=UPI0025AFCE26|nr:sigma factor-like helix-turn-helix DNA-binding protein [Paenibacillus sp. BSR1-1]MDN3015390.1 sigma factor-like helix-turn-helix DNA-binding protein [Paenibacillus sp. BSR1-1]
MSHKPRTFPLEGPHQEDDPFWKEHYPKLQRYCSFLAQNKWDGEDIAQETYLKALRYQQKMSPALLNKIAYHHWIDLLRKRKHETIESDIEKAAPTHQLDETVDMLIEHFTPKQAIIFLLKEAFQYQIKEIADILETTEMAVKSNLHRAKKRLGKEHQSDSLEIFWDEEERELLSKLFKESLLMEDPTVLIQTIPILQSMFNVTKLVTRPAPLNSPSSTLCMAA